MVSNMNDQKCDACNRVENLKPCAYCGEPVTIRYNMMTDEHYISHDDLDSRCSQRPFFGSAEKWNASQTEDMLRGEIIKWYERLGSERVHPNEVNLYSWEGIEHQQPWQIARDALKDGDA